MLAVHALLLGWGAFLHSPTYDEAAHLPAGIRHWTHGDFELFRVNPPLARMVAALPVLLMRPEVDWTLLERPSVPGQRLDFGVGRRFIAANGSRSFWYYSIGRLACVPLSLMGAAVCYHWAKELYGVRAGLLAACLWCFSPTILGHAQIITPDVPAAAFGVLAFYSFWKWLRVPHWPEACSAGIALGLAELTKTTWILAGVLMPLLFVVARVRARFASDAARPRWPALVAIFLIAGYVVNAGYGFSGTFMRLKDYTFVSRALAGTAGGRLPDNRFRGTLLGELPVPLPEQYVLGIDYQKWEFEDGAMSYLRGELRERGGWWYYYLYAILVKAPLGVLLLAAVAIGVRLWRGPWRFGLNDLALLLPLVAVLGLVSSQTSINKHLRYVIPAFPFAYIWISQVAQVRQGLVPRALALCVSGAVASSLWIFPHSMSYFNELVGGPRHGHAHLINSNIDWGQDLFFLKRWLSERGISRVYLVFWSAYDPSLAGIDFETPPPRYELNLDEHGDPAKTLEPGIYAISINHVRGYAFHVHVRRGESKMAPVHSYSYFLNLAPVATAGYSIYLYVIPPPANSDAGQVEGTGGGRPPPGER
jgi:4-amino-4-deoxy-L-arabinose transferase-like glycosyltransferase